MNDMLCPYCEADLFLCLEVWGHEWQFMPCCDELAEEYEFDSSYWSIEKWHSFFRNVTVGHLGDRGLTEELTVDYRLHERLLAGSADWQMSRHFIAQHHRHHRPPVGWKFGVGCWNGPTLVGVATVGRPVAHVLAGRGWLEVTRLCTIHRGGLERLAASKMYAAAAREARRRGAQRIITYILDGEAGISLKAAGWEFL